MLLGIVFIPSLSLFWDIVAFLFGTNEFYIVFQFASAAYYAIFLIFLTKDMDYFNHLWENNRLFNIILNGLFHISGVIIAWLPRFIFAILYAFSNVDMKEAAKLDRIEAQQQIRQFDNMSVAARATLPVGVLTIIMIFIIGFNLCEEGTVSLIHDILNAGVSLVSLFFVLINVKGIKDSK